MNSSPILIVAGEPNSIFLEIFFKSLRSKKFSTPIILIASYKNLLFHMKKLKFKNKIKFIDQKNFSKKDLDNKSINLINVDFEASKVFKKISTKSNGYIKKCFSIAFSLLREGVTDKFINGPISKKNFFSNNKYLGVTEYLSQEFSIKSNAMLIYNKELSVCPITTHLPIKLVAKNINQNIIKEKIELINNFYIKNISFKPKIAVLGLNPHCESIHKFNEDEKILKPAIRSMIDLGYKVSGPYPADTIFLKKNRKKFDVILGMYHDQVLSPLKTIYEYDAINITLGLPFMRISPDHGPNEKMIGQNLSNPISLIKAIDFLDKH